MIKLELLLAIFPMTTHFITAEIDLNASPKQLQKDIEAELRRRGEPLRWAIADASDGKATVEAVVTREDDRGNGSNS